jgi:hypothetical protein
MSDTHRMSGASQSAGFMKVHLMSSDTEPSHTAMGPAVESTTDAPTDATIVTPSTGSTTVITPSSESAIVVPVEPPAVVSPSDEPRYTPETGDAEYGSKLNPERTTPPAAAEPPARFNDATGQ